MCRHSQKRQKWGEMAIFDQFSSISSSICGQTKRASDFVPMNHHRPLNRPRGSNLDYLQRPLMASFRARNLAIQFRSAGRQGTGNLMIFLVLIVSTWYFKVYVDVYANIKEHLSEEMLNERTHFWCWLYVYVISSVRENFCYFLCK